MRCIPLLSALFCADAFAQTSLVGPAADLQVASADWQAYADVNLFAAYDAIAVHNFDSDWSAGYSPRRGRNLFVLRNRVEFGVSKGNWQLGIEYRQQGVLDASQDTVEFYHLYKQREHPQQARGFDINSQFSAWSAIGFRLAHTFALFGSRNNSPLLMLSGTYYGRPRVREVAIQGQVQYQDNDVYSFNAEMLESNTRYRYPFMPDAPQTGSGASVSLALAWPLTEQLSTRLTINDLWSRMRWSNVASKQEQLGSQASSYDKDGYVNYRPLLTGQDSLVNLQRGIGASGAVSVSYRFGLWSASTGLDYLEGETVPIVSARYQSSWGNISASYEHRFGTIGLGYDAGPVRVHLRSNRLDLTQAKALGVDASVNWRF